MSYLIDKYCVRSCCLLVGVVGFLLGRWRVRQAAELMQEPSAAQVPESESER